MTFTSPGRLMPVLITEGGSEGSKRGTPSEILDFPPAIPEQRFQQRQPLWARCL